MKYLQSCLQNGGFVDTTILLMSISLVETDLLY